MDVPIAISSALGSCCGCMIFVELLAKEDAGSMNLMTFSTFLFVSLHGFIFTSKFLTVKNKIPLTAYFQIVVIFFVVNVINNQALNFHIPVPLHIIFRSGSLIANLLMGMWILKKRYPIMKYMSVVLVTIGIITCTLATSGTDAKKIHDATDAETEKGDKNYVEWLIGLTMLWIALFFSALLGIRQEQLYTKYGKNNNQEALFYVHVLSLPAFVFMAGDIYKHVQIFNDSEPTFGVPKLWLYLLLNDIAQYACISSVYKLSAECSSLTVTLVVTLRKFISLIVSIVYFGNPFTFQHWIGTAFVFGGTLLFSNIPAQIRAYKEIKAKTE